MQLETRLDDLEQRFDSAHLAYLHATSERSVAFKSFARKDKERNREIAQKLRSIERDEFSVLRLKANEAHRIRDHERKHVLLTAEKDFVRKELVSLKVIALLLLRFKHSIKCEFARKICDAFVFIIIRGR